MSIIVEGARKQFGDFVALDDVSIQVPDGSLTALLGPSGSGKSTLLRVIAGLEQPDSGRVMISGREATSVPAQQRGVGFVFQHYAAFKHMTVRDNIAFGLEIRKRPKEEIERRVSELVGLVHLDGFTDRYPSQLSGGQRQRMALARALAVVAEQIVVMNDGNVEQAGSPTELYEHPRTEFVMSFVGAVNRRGAMFIRPHDLEVLRAPAPEAEEAMIERIVRFGFEVRVELLLPDGQQIWAQMTKDNADLEGLSEGEIVYARPRRAKVFEPNGESRTEELRAA